MQHGFCTYMQYIKVTAFKVQAFLKQDQSITDLSAAAGSRTSTSTSNTYKQAILLTIILITAK